MHKVIASAVLFVMLHVVASAQVPGERIVAMRAAAPAKGWTFDVGKNDATRQPLAAVCGLRVPPNWRATARFRTFAQKEGLPAVFDWRTVAGCPPVRNQLGCGSCWAFGTIGAFECSILIRDGMVVDLSEQWLVSCNQETDPPHALGDGAWGCQGGWWAHDYHAGFKADPCGGTGAVLESTFPYSGTNGTCACPYPHEYAFDDWAFVGPEEGLPEVDAIKQAILTYGPVSAAVYVGDAFAGYLGGVFNENEDQEVNHAIVLVGWDDAQGTNGVWILRNSWGAGWGESGYMRIEYGCSNVGYSACYVDYAGRGQGRGPAITTQPESLSLTRGWFGRLRVAADGIGTLHYRWQHNGADIGTDASECYIAHASDSDTGSYTCEVSDVRGSTQSNTAAVELDPLATLPLHGHVFVVAAMLVGVVLAFRKRHSIRPGTQ